MSCYTEKKEKIYQNSPNEYLLKFNNQKKPQKNTRINWEMVQS